jgi:hypothetical protein
MRFTHLGEFQIRDFKAISDCLSARSGFSGCGRTVRPVSPGPSSLVSVDPRSAGEVGWATKKSDLYLVGRESPAADLDGSISGSRILKPAKGQFPAIHEDPHGLCAGPIDMHNGAKL